LDKTILNKGMISVHETVKKGLENLEKTIEAQDLTNEDKEGTNAETVKSEKLRGDNADNIYE
jgi:hypothetical protein